MNERSYSSLRNVSVTGKKWAVRGISPPLVFLLLLQTTALFHCLLLGTNKPSFFILFFLSLSSTSASLSLSLSSCVFEIVTQPVLAHHRFTRCLVAVGVLYMITSTCAGFISMMIYRSYGVVSPLSYRMKKEYRGKESLLIGRIV